MCFQGFICILCGWLGSLLAAVHHSHGSLMWFSWCSQGIYVIQMWSMHSWCGLRISWGVLFSISRKDSFGMTGWTEFRVFWRFVTFKTSLSYQQRKHHSLWWQVDKGTLSLKSFYYKTTLPRRLGPPTCTLKTQLRSVSDPDTCPLDVSVTERKHCRPGQKKTSTFPCFSVGKTS